MHNIPPRLVNPSTANIALVENLFLFFSCCCYFNPRAERFDPQQSCTLYTNTTCTRDKHRRRRWNVLAELGSFGCAVRHEKSFIFIIGTFHWITRGRKIFSQQTELTNGSLICNQSNWEIDRLLGKIIRRIIAQMLYYWTDLVDWLIQSIFQCFVSKFQLSLKYLQI